MCSNNIGSWGDIYLFHEDGAAESVGAYVSVTAIKCSLPNSAVSDADYPSLSFY